jgi:N-acetylglucosaminyldiphosphoundecaprenol N-acetyl-beta-D-mannosaminyltransferase
MLLKMLSEKIIFDLKINCFDYYTLEESILTAIQNKQKINILYVNFFSVNLTKKDSIFRDIINSADIVFPDGVGIWMASKMIKANSFNKSFNLTDNGFQLLQFFTKNNLSVFLFGNKQEIIEQAELQIHKREPNIIISGSLNGYTNKTDDELVETINSSSPDVILVGLGTPKQEEWIYTNKQKLNSKIIISVGDLFGLYAGKKKRGPKILQRMGLEWLVRLIIQPSNYYKRYILGIPKFIIVVFKEWLENLKHQ